MVRDDDKRRRDEEEEPHGIIIEDRRHGRSGEAEEPAAPEEPEAPAEPEQPAEPEPPSAPEPGDVVEFPAGSAQDEGDSVPDGRPQAQVPPQENIPPGGPAGAEADDSPEMEQLKMIFGMGLDGYLQSQLGLLLNFAIISLGRAPNPATGLVSTELDKAKLAIDLLEFIYARIKSGLPEQAQAELTQIIGDLKYSFMQAAASGPAGTPGDGEM